MSHSLAIVLAAGQGTRMRSQKPKVLHEIGNLPMLWHALNAASGAGADQLAVVVGPDSEGLKQKISEDYPASKIFDQIDRLGTGHAVLMAKDAIQAAKNGKVVVLYGDVPLIRQETVAKMLAALDDKDLVVLGFEAKDPAGYGRLLVEGDKLKAIREHKDATEKERQVTLCNSGLMAFRASEAVSALEGLGNSNAQGEYYLTDLVEAYAQKGKNVGYLRTDETEVSGVNNRLQLSEAEAIFQKRKREELMLSGVTLLAPETCFFSHDTDIEPDVLIEQNVVFGPGVKVETGAHIRAFCYFEGAYIGSKAVVGPYARLREGTVLGPKAKVGNFVETKKAKVDEGAKINHLSYIGDAEVGAEANIGAGTITCNYDGFSKYKTKIGANSFVGSNSALVAPVSIGEGAYVGSGSVITEDVAPDDLAIARGKQISKPGWAKAFREKKR